MTLSELRATFVQRRREDNYARATLEGYNRELRKFISFVARHFGVSEAHQLEREVIEAFVRSVSRRTHYQTRKPLSHYSRQAALSSVRQFLRFLVDEDLLFSDYDHLFDVRCKERRVVRDVLSEKQVREVLKLPALDTYIGFRDRTILELLYSTGLRLGEVCALEIYDLHFEQKLIFVRQGKGKKDRVVPLGAYLERCLREYINAVRPALAQDNVAENRLFLSIGGGALSPSGLHQRIRYYSRKAGIRFSAHTFRHSFATHLLKSGLSVIYIQRLLGHEKIHTTDIYTHVYPKDLIRIIRTKHPRSTRLLANEEIKLPGKRRKVR